MTMTASTACKCKPVAVLGMSGGVDSSAAALMLTEQGYEVLGVTLHLYDNETIGLDSRTCCSLDDVEDARRTCWKLGCRHFTLNRKELFLDEVIEPFVDTYRRGNTPNPCIDCNRRVKIPALYRFMREMGGQVIATGHYVRVEHTPDGRHLLKKGLDAKKDQSYMLYTMTQEQLAHAVFPLGEMTKEQIRQYAEEKRLSSAYKPDSQDICFVPNGDYVDFLTRHTGKAPEPGQFLDPEGKVLGVHRGYVGYTIGQRKGLGVPAASRLYVYEKDPASNIVRLGEESRIYSRELDVERINLIGMDKIDSELHCKAKIRYHHAEQPCTVVQTGEDTFHVTFDQPQRAIAPGQSLVLYDGDYVLGGGVIV